MDTNNIQTGTFDDELNAQKIELEKQRKRKNVPESEYLTHMKKYLKIIKKRLI